MLTILSIPGLFQHPDIFLIRLEELVILCLVVITLWYMRVISNAFKNNMFFEKRIVKSLKHLSLLLIVYVLTDYCFHLLINSGAYISSGNAIADFIVQYFKPINYSMLFLSAISFLLSFVASEGNELKEENNLTI
jgi:hypothetical protein